MFSTKMLTTEEQRLQIEEGKRLAAQEANARTISNRPKLSVSKEYKSKSKGDRSPKGHEAFLKMLETSALPIEIEKCDGTIAEGFVKHSDPYTISIRCRHSGNDRVIFKHDISEFRVIHPPKTEPETETESA